MSGVLQSPAGAVFDNLAASDPQSSSHTRASSSPQNCSKPVTSDDDKTDEAVDPAFALRVDTSCARSPDTINDMELPPLSPLTPVPSDFEYDHLASAPPVSPRRNPSRAPKKQQKAKSAPSKPKVTGRPTVKSTGRISVASRAQRKDRVAVASRDPAALARKKSLRSSAKQISGRSKKKSSGRKPATVTTSLGKRTARRSKPATPARASAPHLIYDTTEPTPDWIRRSTRLNPGMALSSAAPAASPTPPMGPSPAAMTDDSFAGPCADPAATTSFDDAVPPAPSAGPAIPAVDDTSELAPLADARPTPCAPPAPVSAQASPSCDPSFHAVHSLDDLGAVSDLQAARPPVGHPFAIKCVECAEDALDCIHGAGRCDSDVERRPGSLGPDEQLGPARIDLPPASTGYVQCATPVGAAAPTDFCEVNATTPPHPSQKDVLEVPPPADQLPVVQPQNPHLAWKGTSPPPTGRLGAGTAMRKRRGSLQGPGLTPLDERRVALPSIHSFNGVPPTPGSIPRKRRRVQASPGPEPESTQASVQPGDIPLPFGPSDSDCPAAFVVQGAAMPTAPPTPQNATLEVVTGTLPDASPMPAPTCERPRSAEPSCEVPPQVLHRTRSVTPTPAATQPELLESTPEPRRSKRKRAIVNMQELPLPRLKKARTERALVVEKPRERLFIRIPARSRSQTSAEDLPVAVAVDRPHMATAEAGPSSRPDVVNEVVQGDGGEVAALPSPANVIPKLERLWKDVAEPCSVPSLPMRQPLPSGCRPQLWAQTRQELCESVPWFRTYQAGVYSKDNVVYGYMLGGCGAPRDVFTHGGKVIISHIGGGQEIVKDDDDGNDPGQLADHGAPTTKGPGRARKTRLRENQGESWPGHRAALDTARRNQHPMILIADRQYARFPYEFAPDETYYALGWYWITYMWEEAEPGKQPTDSHARVKVCFQWVESQGNPWWWPPPVCGHSSASSTTTKELVATDSVDQSRLQRGSRPRKVFSAQIGARTSGSEAHSQECPKCGLTFKRIYLLGWMCLDAQCDAFWTLEDGTSPRGETFEMDPAFIALQETPPHVAASIGDYRPSLPAVSDENGFTTSLSFRQGFFCDNCGRVSTRSQWECWQCPGCKNRFTIDWARHNASAWQAGDGVPPWGQCRIHDESVRLQRLILPVDDRGTMARANQFILPHNRGCIYQILGNDATNCAADSILQLYQVDFVEKPLFRRMPLANHALSTVLLTQYFSQNSGVPYKYVAGTDTTIPFSEAPVSVNMALELITMRARLVAPGAEFNELLTAGYLEGQKMNFHSDYEKGLGEDVAALSLGSPALMKFRYNKSLSHRRVLEFTLNHGDILVMHGSGIQNCYEHTVIPTGFRIAATARLIDSRNALESSALARKPMQIGTADMVELVPPPDLSGMTLVQGDHLLKEGEPLDSGEMAVAASGSASALPPDQVLEVQGENDDGSNSRSIRNAMARYVDDWCKYPVELL